MAKLPHIPSYDTKGQKSQNTIKRRMEDGSFMGRVKSDPNEEFQLVYKDRPVQEYLDTVDFYETYGETTKFQFDHPLTGITYDVVFDTPVEWVSGSFDTVTFSFTLKQWVGGDIVLPTISDLPMSGLRVDYMFTDLGQANSSTIFEVQNRAPNWAEESLQQFTTTNRPLYITTGAYPVARFDGVDNQMTSNDEIVLNDFTIFVVYKAVGTSPNNYERLVDLNFETGGMAIMRGGTDADTFGVSINQPTYPYAQYANYNDGDTHVIYGGRYSDATYLFKDGATLSQQIGNADEITGYLRVGGNSPFSTAYYEGDIVRIVIYDTFLSTLKRHQVFNFLNDLYT